MIAVATSPADQSAIRDGYHGTVGDGRARSWAALASTSDRERRDTANRGPVGRDGPLRGLDGSSVADRFRAWTGRSGRRYVFSVFALDGAIGEEDLPLAGSAVVIGVERHRDGTRRPVFVTESDASPVALLRSGPVSALRAARGGELHMHLMAEDGAKRRSIVADLAG